MIEIVEFCNKIAFYSVPSNLLNRLNRRYYVIYFSYIGKSLIIYKYFRLKSALDEYHRQLAAGDKVELIVATRRPRYNLTIKEVAEDPTCILHCSEENVFNAD